MYLFQLSFAWCELFGVGSLGVKLPLHLVTGQLNFPQSSLSQPREFPVADSQPQGTGTELFHRAHRQHKVLADEVRAEAAPARNCLLGQGVKWREADTNKYPTASSSVPKQPQEVDHQGARIWAKEQGKVKERRCLGRDRERVGAIVGETWLPLLAANTGSTCCEPTALTESITFSTNSSASPYHPARFGYKAELGEGGQGGSSMTSSFTGWAGKSRSTETAHWESSSGRLCKLSWPRRAGVEWESADVIFRRRRAAFRRRALQNIPIQLFVLLLDRLSTRRRS